MVNQQIGLEYVCKFCIYIIVTNFLFWSTSATLQFCYRGEREIFSEYDELPTALLENSAVCPGGILFDRQITLKAVTANSDTYGFSFI